MSDLEALPNIGSALAGRLHTAGIIDADTLRRFGSVAALLKIGAAGHPGCYNMLFALEGAIRGIRWHDIPANERSWLKEQLDDARSAKTRTLHGDA